MALADGAEAAMMLAELESRLAATESDLQAALAAERSVSAQLHDAVAAREAISFY